MPSHRILFSLSLSVFLHLAAFGTGDLLCRMQEKRVRPPLARLDATLRLPAPEMAPQALLKDTIAAAEQQPRHPVKDKPARQGMRAAAKAQKKLAEHVYYPEAAVAAGIEGDVRLLLTLDDRGRIKEVQIADSSGYPILDRAAVRAAYAMGTVPEADGRELILPVTFRLQP
jgi:periplasmic protein TonB